MQFSPFSMSRVVTCLKGPHTGYMYIYTYFLLNTSMKGNPFRVAKAREALKNRTSEIPSLQYVFL